MYGTDGLIKSSVAGRQCYELGSELSVHAIPPLHDHPARPRVHYLTRPRVLPPVVAEDF